MKIFIKSILMATILIVSMDAQLNAQIEKYIINEDTTWGVENSPYVLSSDIQVADERTLTIEPGVQVLNPGRNVIELFQGSKLIAIGTSQNNIMMEGVIITGGCGLLPYQGEIHLDYCILKGGEIFHDCGKRKVIITNSKLYYYDYLFIGCSEAEGIIKKNIFVESDYILLSSDTHYTIENNVFLKPNEYGAIGNGHVIDPKYTHIIQYNSFLSTDVVAIYKNFEEVKNNYWNTTDRSVIDEMIYDRNDDLANNFYTEYDPFLIAPHPDTPLIAVEAEAGDNITVNEGEAVFLNGSKSFSNIEILEYQWVQMSGPQIILSNAKSATPGFLAPEAEIEGNNLSFELTITTIGGLSDKDRCLVSVVNQNDPPVNDDKDADDYTENQGDCNDNNATIHPGAIEICGDGVDQDCNGSDLACAPNAPIANAGDDQTVNSGNTITLDGSGSQDTDGTIASYLWTQTAGSTVSLSQNNVIKPTFLAPAVSEATTLTFQLTVTDNSGLTSTDTVDITVNKASSGGSGGGGGCFISNISKN